MEGCALPRDQMFFKILVFDQKILVTLKRRHTTSLQKVAKEICIFQENPD